MALEVTTAAGAARNASIKPANNRGVVFTLQRIPPAPVLPAVASSIHAAPTQGVFPALLCPASYNSVGVPNTLMFQFASVKFPVVCVVIREELPKRTTAVLFVVVVNAGTFDNVVESAVSQDPGLTTSKGFVLLTPENATMAPVVAEELVVTVKV